MTSEQKRSDLLKRLEWAVKHLSDGRQAFESMLFAYKLEAPNTGWDSEHGYLDRRGIPTADQINSGFDKTNMVARCNAFPDTVSQLKASVECTAVVEAKIQKELAEHQFVIMNDAYRVSGFSWIVVIFYKENALVSLDRFRECIAHSSEEMRKSTYDYIEKNAADGFIWLGQENSPEVALASAMVDFRRDQLRLLGLHA